jgi:hypothetical protein
VLQIHLLLLALVVVAIVVVDHSDSFFREIINFFEETKPYGVRKKIEGGRAKGEIRYFNFGSLIFHL